MAQSAITIRMDSDTKKEFESLCRDFGMSANTAFNIFARAVVRSKGIPFPIQARATGKAWEAVGEMREISTANGNCDMTLDEINAEIAAARTERK